MFQIVKQFTIDGKISEQTFEVANKLEKYLNEEIKSWAIRTLNTSDCRFEFKRETLCDYGIFLEKKRYVLHMLDKEGFAPEDPWKYTGVEVVSTKMPKAVKPYVKGLIFLWYLISSNKLPTTITSAPALQHAVTLLASLMPPPIINGIFISCLTALIIFSGTDWCAPLPASI